MTDTVQINVSPEAAFEFERCRDIIWAVEGDHPDNNKVIEVLTKRFLNLAVRKQQ